jgi:hypothetical protein
MNPTIQSPASAPLFVNFAELEGAVAQAANVARQLVADPQQGGSPFAAGIRSAIDHANELIALQKQWAANNPVAAPRESAAV